MSEWLAHPYGRAALERAVASYEGARLLGVLADPWRPESAVTVVVAYDWQRLAGLRSWREQFDTHCEIDAQTYVVTSYECGYLCRLLTRGIGRAVVCARGRIVQDSAGALAELGALAAQWWDDRAVTWLGAAGLALPSASELGAPNQPSAERFDRLDGWVLAQRALPAP
jgi:hypothetical protein